DHPRRGTRCRWRGAWGVRASRTRRARFRDGTQQARRHHIERPENRSTLRSEGREIWPAWPRFRTFQVCDQSGCESIGPDDYTRFSAMLLALLLFAAYARLPGVRRPLFEWIDIKCQDSRGGATKQPAMVRGWGFSKAEWYLSDAARSRSVL